MTTKPTGVWLREGDLVYRLAETPHGVSNCDEIKVSQADGRRLSAACHERAEDLLVALQAVERAKAWQPPHDGIRAALAAVPPDGEWRGFAAECAQQYGAEYLDDDAKLVVMTEENLVNMMAALGYPTWPRVTQPVARQGAAAEPTGASRPPVIDRFALIGDPGAECVRNGHGYWELHRDGSLVRGLSRFERNYIDSAIRACQMHGDGA